MTSSTPEEHSWYRRSTAPDVSFIIPAYNEEHRLLPFLSTIKDYILQNNLSAEVIVVDDGSTDGTTRVAADFMGPKAVLRLGVNQGKGAAVKFGMEASRGRYRCFLDADGSTPIEEERSLRDALENGADIAIGSRAAEGGKRTWLGSDSQESSNEGDVVWNVKPHRHLIGRIFALTTKVFLGLNFRDTQCGAKMFKAEAARQVFGKMKIKRFAFDVEALFLARRFRLRVEEIPVNWQDVADSKVNLWRDPFAMAFSLIRIRWLHRSDR